jgi:hypothetical protein
LPIWNKSSLKVSHIYKLVAIFEEMKTKMKIRIISSLIFFTLLTSCNVNEKFIGKYRSNFAEIGFFITKIELKKDKTFHYVFSGDLIYTELDGKYIIKNKNLYLKFNKLKGETESEIIKVNGKDTIVNFENMEKTHSYELKKENEIDYHLKYKISNQKLFAYNVNTNKIVRNANDYFSTRKYLIFGSKYYKKKKYLMKVEK